MANVVIGTPVWSDSGTTLSGGSWTVGLPLTNLQDRRLHVLARTTNAQLTSTLVRWDLGAARAVRCVMVPKHSCSSGASYRVRHLVAEPVIETSAIDTWVDAAGTPTVTTGQTDPFGGTRAVLIEDNDTLTDERKRLNVTFAADGTRAVAWSIKQGTATTCYLRVRDNTAGVTRLQVTATFTAGVPTLVADAGSGTVFEPVALGNGWYACRALVDNIVAANTNQLLVGINFDPAATGTALFYEVMTFNVTSDPIPYDSGMLDAWTAGETTESRAALNRPLVAVTPAAVTTRYGRLEIADTANPLGYLDLHRLLVTGGLQPTTNFAPGAQLALESETTTAYAAGGNAVHDIRPLRRTVRLQVNALPESEAVVTAWRAMAQLGPRGQCALVLDPDASAGVRAETSFVAVPRELTALEFLPTTDRTLAFAFTEEL